MNFVGRAAEYEQLTAAWKATVASRERRVMLLSGEPGIGKTTLSARFAGQVYDEGAAVIYGRCDEDLGIPYQPWIEALARARAPRAGSRSSRRTSPSGARTSLRLVPELGRRVETEAPAALDADSERFVLFECVIDLLARTAAEYPVLLVLDDLHWADRPTIQLLRHVVLADRPMALGILGTFRDSDITHRPSADRAARARCTGRAGRSDSRCAASATTTCCSCSRPSPVTRWTSRASRCATRCSRRPQGTRSSWPRSSATSPRPARSTSGTTDAGSPTPTCGPSGCRSACARSSAAASPGSVPTPNASSPSARSSAATSTSRSSPRSPRSTRTP